MAREWIQQKKAGWTGSDPAAALKGAITRSKVKHNRPPSRAEITEFLKALDSSGGYRTTMIALRLALLTFVRTKDGERLDPGAACTPSRADQAMAPVGPLDGAEDSGR